MVFKINKKSSSMNSKSQQGTEDITATSDYNNVVSFDAYKKSTITSSSNEVTLSYKEALQELMDEAELLES